VPASPAITPSTRLVSLDAYRGFVMFLMAAEVLHLSRIARNFPDNPLWHFLAYHQTHVDWIGCSLHDLIQPSFSFMVGVALPFSIASRRAKGQSFREMFGHALFRSLILIWLGIFLRSIDAKQTNYTFEDTLTQIGLGYAFLFLLGFASFRTQWIALVIILIGYWAAFALYPLPGLDFDWTKVGVPADWPHHLRGFAQHWDKNSNLGAAFDQWFLNLFPRAKPFVYNGGGYLTLSFIPTLGTMIFGLIAGNWLRSDRTGQEKFTRLVRAGVICLVAGTLLHLAGICPIVKRIWTPTWTIFSAGWTFLLLAGFYAIIDLRGYKRWAFPLVVIGMNSIAMYCMAHLIDGFILNSFKIHFGQNVFNLFGAKLAPFVSGIAVLLVLWLILFWMHRRKLYLRV
jgi:heparan-alpha-glucosaminide N-acetyltransferase